MVDGLYFLMNVSVLTKGITNLGSFKLVSIPYSWTLLKWVPKVSCVLKAEYAPLIFILKSAAP